MIRIVTFVVVAGLLASGCATTGVPAPAGNRPVADPSMDELNRIAGDAQRSLQLLANAHAAQAQAQVTPEVARRMTLADTATPAGWEARSWLEFEGAFNLLVRRLSEESGYRYHQTGNFPTNPPMVFVRADGRSRMDVLRDVISQLPSTVQVNLYPATRSVVVSMNGG